MLKSPLFRISTLALLAALVFTGCANNRGVHGDGTGSDGAINDPLYNGGIDGTGSELPSREEFGNPSEADYLTLAPYTVYFAFDSFTIAPEERGKLEKTADYLKDHPGTKIWLAGHTDARGTTQYNLALGERRANATREYLIGLGVPANRMQTTSYGEERPAEAGSSEAAYAKNRRVQAGIVR